MRKYIAGALLGALLFSSCESLINSANEAAKQVQIPMGENGNLPLSESEIINGLKTALSVATDSSVNRLHAVNGFLGDAALKILLPPESQALIEKLNQLEPTKKLVDKTITAINRAAEDAAKEAGPIFKDAITNMKFSDARNILNGDDTSATHYLRNATYSKLWDAFKPKIEKSLKKELVYGQSAESLYSSMLSAYNTASLNGMLFEKIQSNSLSDHATGKALQGLFVKVGDEEKQIRTDLSHRVNDILKRVFAK